MKIVYFNYLYDRFGMSIGSTRKAEQLMKALSQLGHDIRIFWMKPESRFNGSALGQVKNTLKKRFSGYLHDPKQLASNIPYLIREYRILKHEKPDLVISRLDNYLFSSLLVCKLLRIPLVIEADAPGRYEIQKFCPEFRHMARIARWIENITMNHAELSICVSETMRSYFILEGTRPEKVLTISNGADMEQFNPARRSPELLSKYQLTDKVIIGFIGSFHAWHGVENMIHAIGHVFMKYSNVAFLLIGQGGAMRDKLKELAQEKQFASRIILIDYVDYAAIPEYVATMDICLALYPNLPFFYFSPMKVYEYMASGKAVIASRIGQIEDIIQNNENGLLYEPDQTDRMTAALEYLIENPARRTQIGESARKTIEQMHSWKHKAQAWSDLCERIVKNYGQ